MERAVGRTLKKKRRKRCNFKMKNQPRIHEKSGKTQVCQSVAGHLTSRINWGGRKKNVDKREGAAGKLALAATAHKGGTADKKEGGIFGATNWWLSEGDTLEKTAGGGGKT